MTQTYLDNLKVEVYIDSAWEDITADIVSSIDVEEGIQGLTPADRTASSGYLKFTLNNSFSNLGGVDFYYTPKLPQSKSGWGKGVQVRLMVTYIDEVCKFFGRIDTLEFDNVNRRVKVNVIDYMEVLQRQTLSLPTLQYNQRIDQIATTLLTQVPIQPQSTNFSVGNENFEIVFDTVKQQTRALQELHKLVLSEFSYAYIKHSRSSNEEFRIENKYDRSLGATLSRVPVQPAYWVDENDNYIVTENGDKIVFSQADDALYDVSLNAIEQTYGDVINKISFTTYPRSIDTGNVVLFSLTSPIQLKAGQSIELIGNYRDPTSKSTRVGGKSMVAPVATTDYLMYQNSNGTGLNLTASLSVTASYAANAVFYQLSNTGATDGYITKLQARGLGVYTYDSTTYTTEDTTSVNAYGYSELSLDMKYQNDIRVAKDLADLTLAQQKDPIVNVKSVSFVANESELWLSGFVWLEPGSLVQIRENSSGINGYYHIQNIKFSIFQGGVINCKWSVIPALGLGANYWQLDTVGSSELDQTTYLGY